MRKRPQRGFGLPLTIVTLCFFLSNCRPVLTDPSGVQRATYAEEVAEPSTRKQETEKPSARRPAPPQVDSQPENLPLPPRGARGGENGQPSPERAFKSGSGLSTGLGSLAVVLALFFAAAWAVRRGLPQGPVKLPAEVVEVLGRTPLAQRQFALLIRCGNKLLLVHVAPGSAETLTEITDPVEVDRLAGLCRQTHPQSATASFRQVFQQFSREKRQEAT